MTLKAGVIGFGKMGKLHCKGYRAVGAEIVGIYDLTANDCNEKTFPSVAELVKECDVISICTPSSTHKAIAKVCIEAGVAVMVEKPLALNSADCLTLLSLAKQHNIILSVGHIERFNASFQVLKENISSVGKIQSVQVKRTNPSSDRISDADVIADLTVHDLDLIKNICNGDKLSDVIVSSVIHNENNNLIDEITATAKLNNILVYIHTSRVSQSSTREITVVGDNGVLKADLLTKTLSFNDDNIPVQPCDQIISQIGSFTTAILNNQTPLVTADDGLFAVESADYLREIAK